MRFRLPWTIQPEDNLFVSAVTVCREVFRLDRAEHQVMTSRAPRQLCLQSIAQKWIERNPSWTPTPTESQ